MNRPFLLALTLALIGASAAPAPLVVGTIRDQHGAPIEGARVRLLEGHRMVGQATSGVDGTFSAAVAADRIHVDCAYCRSADVPVSSDGTAVAIVTRYDAIASEVPTPEDLAHLPYARIESDIALTPFIVLNQSSRSIPGPSLDDRNAYPQSGMIVINGVPDYDIVAATTPLDTTAYRDATSVSVSRTDDAYTYDDLANAGTFGISTSGGASLAYGGSDTGVRVRGGGDVNASAAWSNWNQGDRRAEFDAALPFSSGTTQGSVNIASREGAIDARGGAGLDGAFSSARASIEKSARIDTFANAIVDRATYAYRSAYAPANAQWSDVDLDVGARSHGIVAPFAQIEARTSAGTYWAPSVGGGSVATVLQETRGVAGLDVTQRAFDAEFTVGTGNLRYSGGYPGTSGASVAAPTASGSLDAQLSSNWKLHLGANRGNVLQTFLGLFENDGLAPVDATSLSEAMLTYDGKSRLRSSFTTLTSRDEFGIASSATGVSVAWQIAPALSLRTWLMRAQTTNQSSQTLGSAWLTYQMHGLRVDAIWRRDLLDHRPDAHLDASVGGDLSPTMQWFLATEQRQGIRATDAGIRF